MSAGAVVEPWIWLLRAGRATVAVLVPLQLIFKDATFSSFVFLTPLFCKALSLATVFHQAPQNVLFCVRKRISCDA